MDLNQLLKISAPETELVELLAAMLQRNYLELREACSFIKLEKCGEQQSTFAWIKSFDNPYDLKDFYYDTVMERACILFRYQKDHYEILCHGYFYSNWIEVWPDHVTEGMPSICSGNIETNHMPPRELIEKGFAELTGIMTHSNRKESV